LNRRSVPVELDVNSYVPVDTVRLALPRHSPLTELDVWIKPAEPDQVEIGFEANGNLDEQAVIGPDSPAMIGVRSLIRPGDIVPRGTITIRRCIRYQPSRVRGAGGEDTLDLPVRFVTHRFVAPDLVPEPAGRLQYTERELCAAEATYVPIATILIRQDAAAFAYAGSRHVLRIVHEVTINDEPADPAETATRLLSVPSDTAAVWVSRCRGAIALPIEGGSAREPGDVRLEIAVAAGFLCRVAAAAQGPADRWTGRVRLRAAWDTPPADSELAAVPLARGPDTQWLLDIEQHITITLQQGLEVQIADIGAISIPFSPGDLPSAVTTAPYQHSVHVNGANVVHSVPEHLGLALIGSTRPPGEVIKLSARVAGSDGRESKEFAIGDWRPVPNGALASQVSVPLRDLMKQAGLFTVGRQNHLHGGQLRLLLTRQSGDRRESALIAVPLELERRPPQWLVCVDLGTSATSIWIGRARLADHPSAPLPLGLWLRRADPNHAEYVPDRRDDEQLLIPSYIGLGSQNQFRREFDLLSLGDLNLSGSEPVAVAARLRELGRRYDLSVPFAPANDIAACAGEIIFDPKRRLMKSDRTITLEGQTQIYEFRDNGANRAELTHTVEIEPLIGDYFDELGRYVIPRSLTTAAGLPGGVGADSQLTADEWIQQGFRELGAVLTYPGGIEHDRKSVYLNAGARLVTALNGEPPETGVQDAWVKLIPEALAAARFGIDEIIRTERLADGADHAFGAIDIGAGTYDVTLVSVRIQDRRLADWKVLSHFGVLLGGHDLDFAIAAEVLRVIKAAAGQADLPRLFDICTVLPLATAEMQTTADEAERRRGHHFLRGIQAAKRALTDALMLGDTYRWAGPEEAGAPRFDMVVWRPDGLEWPITPSTALLNASQVNTWPIDGRDAVLRLDREQGTLTLSLGPSVFTEVPEQPDRTRAGSLVELMGEALPAMTAAEASRLELGPMRWIVTGRAALWPPLYEAIRRTVDAADGGARLVPEKPFSADLMKEAVLLGAIQLANERLDLGTTVLYPLAVLTDSRRQPARDPGASRGVAESTFGGLRYLDGSRMPDGAVENLAVQGRFQIVRALPGLDDPLTRDRRVALLDMVRIRPWDDVCNQEFYRAPSDNQKNITLRWRRSESSIEITVEDPSANSHLKIGPIPRNGRIYGARS
jgi:hypothetical protein